MTMKPYWRQTPLSDEETTLYRLTLDAHGRSVRRDNISSNVVLNVGVGSGQVTNAIAAAVLSIGGVHAPLVQTINALTSDVSDVEWRQLLDGGLVIPGWGNSFCKVDELWADVESFGRTHWPAWWAKADRITKLLHDYGRDIYPNPSLYTAITAIVLDVPKAMSPIIFIEGRLWAWAEIATQGGKL